MASTKFDPDAALVKKPTAADKARAEDHLARIKAGLVEAPALLNTFIRQDEWQLLGYASLADCYEKSGLKDAVQQGEVSRKVLVHTLREKGHTVRQIAGVLEISPAQVSRIGSGKTGHEAEDERKELGGDDTSGGVTPGVTSTTEDVRTSKLDDDALGKPDKTAPPVLTPTATLTPGEVAERSFGRHQPVVDSYNALSDQEKAAFMATVSLPGGTVTVKRRIDQLRNDLLTSREETRRAVEQSANGRRRSDDELDYDEVGNMLTRD